MIALRGHAFVPLTWLSDDCRHRPAIEELLALIERRVRDATQEAQDRSQSASAREAGASMDSPAERHAGVPAARRRRTPDKPGEGGSEFSVWTILVPPGSSLPEWSCTALVARDGTVLAPTVLGTYGEAATTLRAVNAGARVASRGGQTFVDLEWLRSTFRDRAALLAEFGARARREVAFPLTAIERRRASDARLRAEGFTRASAWLPTAQVAMLDALAKECLLLPDRTNTVAFAVKASFAQTRKHKNLMAKHRKSPAA